MSELAKALKYFLIAKWRELTHYDLKGDLQMDSRAARQDLQEAWQRTKLESTR